MKCISGLSNYVSTELEREHLKSRIWACTESGFALLRRRFYALCADSACVKIDFFGGAELHKFLHLAFEKWRLYCIAENSFRWGKNLQNSESRKMVIVGIKSSNIQIYGIYWKTRRLIHFFFFLFFRTCWHKLVWMI